MIVISFCCVLFFCKFLCVSLSLFYEGLRGFFCLNPTYCFSCVNIWYFLGYFSIKLHLLFLIQKLSIFSLLNLIFLHLKSSPTKCVHLISDVSSKIFSRLGFLFILIILLNCVNVNTTSRMDVQGTSDFFRTTGLCI